jgi:hypothetical protein
MEQKQGALADLDELLEDATLDDLTSIRDQIGEIAFSRTPIDLAIYKEIKRALEQHLAVWQAEQEK